ncbi:MAG: UvrD-helicase domain-containing protein [Clostridia bacterium]|nr:UvrD-helicase domain-containing protein [Clostridia bacterium]
MQDQGLRARFTAAKRALFDKMNEKYNAPQREAIYAVNGPLLVLAGAGSGKTSVLVRRIAQIIRFGNAYEDDALPPFVDEEAVKTLEDAAATGEDAEAILSQYAVAPCPPWRMLAITFTNKAAGEMKQRLADMLGEDDASQVWAGTFHAICVRILRRHGASVGVPSNFTIYDQDDAKKVIASCVEELKLDEKVFSPKAVMNVISRAKDRLMDPAELARKAAGDYRMKTCAEIYGLYEEKLRAAQALDFDDIIFFAVRLLSENEEIRRFYQDKFDYISVDEYQDTNRAQLELSKLLAGVKCNLMVVGDDDQSIYRFRGATIENILSFDRDFPDARIVKLEQNYRSTSVILDAANGVISHNEGRHAKKLWCSGAKGDPITLKRLDNQNEEARYIVNKIRSQTQGGKRKYSDFAVLYRINAQSNALENAFAHDAIPYRVLGGTRFYDRKEVKDVIAYLCVVFNPGDNLRLLRIINEPKRKIGGTTIAALGQIAAVEGKSIFEIMESAENYPALAKAQPKLAAFCGLIRSLQKAAAERPLPELFEKTIEDSGYMDMLLAEGITEIDRLENVKELVSNAVEYAETKEDATLGGFLEEVALINDIDRYDENADAVVLMTVHSAKGLEFPVVFLPGMEEGLFPGTQTVNEKRDLEEERRLAYVALTRAKDKVFISHARERMLFGHTQYNQLSRFVNEIPAELISDETEQGGSRSQRIAARKAQLMNDARCNVLGQKHAPKDGAGTAAVSALGEGDEVEHSTFGKGRILSSLKIGPDFLYEVDFETVGVKKLMGSYARLRKI